MTNVLETITAEKRKEVIINKQLRPLSELEQSPYFQRQTNSLCKSLGDKSKTGIIAEFKRRSPSKGVINGNAKVSEVVEAYKTHGASGASVLTDASFFGGSNEDLTSARNIELPILRKDFIIDEYQIVEAKSIGADVILLIAACLTPSEVQKLASLSKSLGLEVLLEIHDENELGHITEEIHIVGVNNRNLKTFEVDLQTSFDLVSKIPAEKVRITESGITDPKDIISLKQVGYEGFLIGENFMRSLNPAAAFADFIHALNLAS